jgi:hypothetical protein
MSRILVLKNFRLVDETMDIRGAVVIEDGRIREIIPAGEDFPENILADKQLEYAVLAADMVIDGARVTGGHDVALFVFIRRNDEPRRSRIHRPERVRDYGFQYPGVPHDFSGTISFAVSIRSRFWFELPSPDRPGI